jgi:hypothetical protein
VAKKQWAGSIRNKGLEEWTYRALRPWQIGSEADITSLFEKLLVWTLPTFSAAFGSTQHCSHAARLAPENLQNLKGTS